MSFDYVYYGDRNTAPILRGKLCSAVRINHKCIRGKNGNMLVKFEAGIFHIVIARSLRKTQKLRGENNSGFTS
jgi:hypothetical protein